MVKFIVLAMIPALLIAGDKKKEVPMNLKLENAVLRIGLAQEQYKNASRLLSDIKIAYDKAVKDLDDLKLSACVSAGGKVVDDCEYSFNGDSSEWKISKKGK